MATKKDTSHCVIRNNKYFCMKCGDERSVPFPIEVNEYVKIGSEFTKRHADCKQTYTPPIVNMELSQIERERWWLEHGERGQSSKSIFATLSLTGLNEYKGNFPYDPDDFSRCHGLLDIVPEFRKQLHKMKDVSDVWSKLFDNWDKLTEMYLELKQYKKSNGMFEFMQTIYK